LELLVINIIGKFDVDAHSQRRPHRQGQGSGPGGDANAHESHVGLVLKNDASGDQCEIITVDACMKLKKATFLIMFIA